MTKYSLILALICLSLSASTHAQSLDHLNLIAEKGDTIHLSQYKGKKLILLDFWASWCGPCRRFMPTVKKLQAKYGGEVEFISIALQDSYADWKEALTKEKMSWQQVLGVERDGNRYKNNDIGLFQNIAGIPAFILIDKNTKVIRKFGGIDQDALPESRLSAELEKAVKGN